jgi:hypothetical protein
VRVNGLPKSDPILAGTRLPFTHLFCHFESVTDITCGILGCHFESIMDITREILGLVTDLVFGTPKTLAVPSYKYAWVPARKNIQKTHNPPQPACCAAAYATSSRSSACTGDRESRSREPRPQRSCIGRGRIKFLEAFCATARTIPHRCTLRPCHHGSSSFSSVGRDSASSSTRRC